MRMPGTSGKLPGARTLVRLTKRRESVTGCHLAGFIPVTSTGTALGLIRDYGGFREDESDGRP